jgi:DNA-binding NtrC family response regulator
MHTVLVVDDEQVIRDGCRRILAPEGYRVLSAASGAEALDLLAAEPISAVLCGLNMPGIGAMKILEEVSATHPDLPMIILTGEGTIANAVECMRKGAYDFITKPFRAHLLASVVKCAVEHLPAPKRLDKLPF